MTIDELIGALVGIRVSAEGAGGWTVYTEGCDCDAIATHVESYPVGVIIKRTER